MSDKIQQRSMHSIQKVTSRICIEVVPVVIARSPNTVQTLVRSVIYSCIIDNVPKASFSKYRIRCTVEKKRIPVQQLNSDKNMVSE